MSRDGDQLRYYQEIRRYSHQPWRKPSVAYTDAGQPIHVGNVEANYGSIGAGGFKTVEGLRFQVELDPKLYSVPPHTKITLGPARTPIMSQPRFRTEPGNDDVNAEVYAAFLDEAEWFQVLKQAFPAEGQERPFPLTSLDHPFGGIVQEGVGLGHSLTDSFEVIFRQLRSAPGLLSQTPRLDRRGHQFDVVMDPTSAHFMLFHNIAKALYTLDSFHALQVTRDETTLLSGYNWFALHPTHNDMGQNEHVNNMLISAMGGPASIIDLSHTRLVRLSDNEAAQVANNPQALRNIPGIRDENLIFTNALKEEIRQSGIANLIPAWIWQQGVWNWETFESYAQKNILQDVARKHGRSLAEAYHVANEEYLHAYIWNQIYTQTRDPRTHIGISLSSREVAAIGKTVEDFYSDSDTMVLNRTLPQR